MSLTVPFIFLILSLSIDVFIAGISLGISKIKTPIFSIFIICFINTFILTISYLLGEQLQCLFSNNWITILSATPFFILGFGKLFDFQSFSKINSSKSLHCIFYIYQDPKIVDLDFSKTLSMKELILLTVSLSFDNFAAGIGMGIKPYSVSFLFLCNLIISFLLFIIGNRLSLKLTKLRLNWSFIGGIILIIVGIYRIFH